MFSCNLSSTPVMPSSSMLHSKASTAFATACSLFTIEALASSKSFFQAWYSRSVSNFCAKTSVLSPSRERSSHQSSTNPRRVYETLSFMTVSAPFMQKMMRAVSTCCNTIPMRLLAEVKGNTCKTRKLSGSPNGFRMTISLRLRSARMSPSDSAILTSAISSGEEAWNVRVPFSSVGVTLWQRARQEMKSLTMKYLSRLKGLYFFPVRWQSYTRWQISSMGPCVFSQCLRRMALRRRSSLAWQLPTSLMESFLKTISFWVRVPVLSERMQWTRPSSSGICPLRVREPSISASWLMRQEKSVLAMSRLTRRLMGMMLERRRICLKRSSSQYSPSPPLTTISTASTIMKQNSTFDRQFSSWSVWPIFCRASCAFITLLISLPAQTTMPIALLLARKQFPQSVFSRLRPSRMPLFWVLASTLKTPSKLQMSSLGASALTVASRPMRLLWLLFCRYWWVKETALRSFQSVSPSSWSVRMKTVPSSSPVLRMTRSAGMRWLDLTSMTCPTLRSRLRMVLVPVFSMSVQGWLLVSSSRFLRQWSSQASLKSVKPRTSSSGARQVKRKPTLSMLMNWLSAMIRKKKLKKQRNWWQSTSGRKDTQVYLLLLITFGSQMLSGYRLPSRQITRSSGTGRARLNSDSGNGIRGGVYLLRPSPSSVSRSFKSCISIYFLLFIDNLIDYHQPNYIPASPQRIAGGNCEQLSPTRKKLDISKEEKGSVKIELPRKAYHIISMV